MRRVACILTIVLVPTFASAQQPEARLGVSGSRQGEGRAAVRARPRRTVGSVSYTRAAVDDFFNVPIWRPQMHPQMSKIVQHGNKDTQVRACGSCHLPTGVGHDESAYMAGLPVGYFIRTMNDWKTGDRKYGGTMVAMLKIITDAEILEAANYFASLKPMPWIRVVETDTVPKTYTGMSTRRLVLPDGGTEPIGNRIVEVPEDEEVVVHRDPLSGFVAYVPKGSIERGRELVMTGGGKTLPCGICHGPTQRGLGDVPGLAGRHPNYIVRQLWNMQNGDRIGNSAALMKQVVDKLTVDDMLAISAYAASLTP